MRKPPALYDVTFRVNAVKLPVILGALDHDATLVGVKPVEAASGEQPPTAQRAAPHYRNGKRNKGITAEALVFECLNRGMSYLYRDGRRVCRAGLRPE